MRKLLHVRPRVNLCSLHVQLTYADDIRGVWGVHYINTKRTCHRRMDTCCCKWKHARHSVIRNHRCFRSPTVLISVAPRTPMARQLFADTRVKLLDVSSPRISEPRIESYGIVAMHRLVMCVSSNTEKRVLHNVENSCMLDFRALIRNMRLDVTVITYSLSLSLFP